MQIATTKCNIHRERPVPSGSAAPQLQDGTRVDGRLWGADGYWRDRHGEEPMGLPGRPSVSPGPTLEESLDANRRAG